MKTIKAYKGFNEDMKCRGFQFEEGKTYTEDAADLCNKGFHACEDPIDCLNYYHPADGAVYHEVELSDVSDQRENDTKVCAKTIKIGAKVDFGAMIKASVDFSLKKTEKGKGIASGNCSTAASSGDSSKAASSGNYSTAASSGNYSTAASSGDSSTAASSGNCSTAASSGDCSTAASSGNCSTAASSGYGSKAEVKGKECIAAAIGRNGKARASLGSWIVVTEIDADGHVLDVKGVKVDGEKIKADTWYQLKNGEFVEVK